MLQPQTKVELSGDKDEYMSFRNVILDLLDHRSLAQQESRNNTRRDSGIAYLNMRTTRRSISISRFRGERVEGQGGALHLILYDTSPLKVFMQKRTFVYKPSPLSTRALSIVYENFERISSRL
jgi:hypothetical protein